MQSLQNAQRVLSSRDCSTSGTSPPLCVSMATRFSCSSFTGSVLTPTAPGNVQRLCHQRPGRRRSARCHAKKQAVLTVALSNLESNVDLPLVGETLVSTIFVAETCLPTRTGKYRVRAYKHSVSSLRYCWPSSAEKEASSPGSDCSGGRWKKLHRANLYHDW